MRIRKNANLSSLMFSPEPLQTHVCQLNQSPWDVITFSQEAYQFEGDDSFNGNGSLGDSIGAVESVSSMVEEAEDNASMKMRIDNMVIDDNYGVLEGISPEKTKRAVFDDCDKEFKFKQRQRIHCCNKANGKAPHCKSESREEHSSLLKSFATNTHSKKSEKARGGRPRAAAKKVSSSISSNPYEFYYYSGFGPRWGKKRGGNKGEGSNSRNKVVDNSTLLLAVATADSQSTTPSSISSPIDCKGELDYIDEDDDEEDIENVGDFYKKRVRKPVKARSLKSLM